MLERHLPLIAQLRETSRDGLVRDVQAGLTTAVMLVPQGMAYAMLAGLPPIVGLYASVVPLVLYALFGSSRQLAVGPVAMVSLMVAAGVGALAEGGTEAYLAYAILLALLVGGIQLFMGVARLGFLVNLLSHPVVSGFTSAAAIVIALSQVQHVLGFAIPSGPVHQVVLGAVTGLGQAHLPTVALALGSVALLVGLKRAWPRFPGALAVVALGSLVVWGLGLADQGVRIVGEVPAGLPMPALPALDPSAALALLPTAIAIALVGFMESVAVAKGYARHHRYELDTDKELVGLGLANLGAALFKAFPVTGGFSRTAVNAQAGATTNLAGLVTAGAVGLTLVFFTPLFHFLPQAVLAAIILTAVLGLVNVAEVRHLWHTDRADLGLLAVTFASTLLIGIEEGIAVGVVASVLWFVARTARPHVAVLGRVREDGLYRNVLRFPTARTWDDVLIVRVDAPLYFANSRFLKQTLADLEAEHAEPLRAVVLDAGSVSAVDSSALATLAEVLEDYQRRGVQLYLAGLRGPVQDALERAHLVERIGRSHLVARVEDALDHLHPPLAPEARVGS